jgi:hypothetical protein
MAVDIEGIVNQALVEIGYPERIASIHEGSKASVAALEIYGQTRDELIRSQHWPFSVRRLPLGAPIKGPPPPGGYTAVDSWNQTFPPPGWLYEYAYPADVLEITAIVPSPQFWPIRDPKPAVFNIANGDLAKVVLCNITPAIAVCRARVIDPGSWEPLFIKTLTEALGKKLAPRLLPASGGMMQEKLGETRMDAALADRQRG